MTENAINCLKKSSLFSDVCERDLISCDEKTPLYFKTLKTGEKIRVKNALILLVSGCLQAEKASGEKNVYLRKIYENDITGIASLFDRSDQYISTISAKKESTLLVVEEGFVDSLIKKSPEFSKKFVTLLCEKIRYLNSRLDSCTKATAEEKVYEFIKSGTSGKKSDFIEMSMSSLSSALGMGRASLYRALSSLEESGKIAKDGKKIYLLREVKS